MDKRKYVPNESEEFLSLQDFNLPDFPLHIDVEITSRCNLNCVFCDKQPLLKENQQGNMDLDLFKLIANQCGKAGLLSMGLSYRGEPLLHKHIDKIIAYSKEMGVGYISFCTNGMLLLPVTSRQLIVAGLDEITISAQGATEETFEHTRLGSNFYKVVQNVEELNKARVTMGVNTPKVRIQAVDLPELDREELIRFWSMRCDEVVIKPYEESTDRQTGIDTDWCCQQPWKRMTIEWDGTILPCFNDDLRLSSPGNAGDVSIWEAWHSPEMQKLREYHGMGWSRRIPDCDGCPFRQVAIKTMKS